MRFHIGTRRWLLFATRDRIVLVVKSTQVRDMTVLQRHSNVDSTHSLVIFNFFTWPCGIEELHFFQNASTVINHGTLTGGI